MSATKLGLYELLAPQFLAGFTFPEHIDRYLAFLSVDVLRMSADESGVVYTGRATFGGGGGALPVLQHRDPSGAVFDWDDVTLDFRLTIPRDGASFISDALNDPPTSTVMQEMNDLFNDFGAVEQTITNPTEYPGVRFRLELMVSALTLHLGSKWVPGEVGDNFRIMLSTDPAYAGQDVKFVLPKVVLEYEQGDKGDDLSQLLVFRLKSWGNAGFDAPHDLAQGELVRMDPPIALHESGRFAFGVDQVLVDLSQDHTPPEILQLFGTDEAFQGLYLKSLRFYYFDPNKDFGLNIAVNDALISLAGEVSLEASVDLLMATPLGGFDVKTRFFDGQEEIQYTKGNSETEDAITTVTGSNASVPQTAVVQIEVQGGFPPYDISVTLDGEELWDSARRDARISPGMPDALREIRDYPYTLVVRVSDFAGVEDPHPYDRHQFTQTIDLAVTLAETELPDGSELDRPPEQGVRQPATLELISGALPPGYAIRLDTPPNTTSESETILVEGGTGTPTITIDGVERPLTQDRRVTFILPHDSISNFTVEYPASGDQSEEFNLFFDLDKPAGPTDTFQQTNTYLSYIEDRPDPRDTRFSRSSAPSGNTSLRGAEALRKWVENRVISSSNKKVTIDSHASFEYNKLADHDMRLSERRRMVAMGIIGELADVTGGRSHGHEEAERNNRRADQNDRFAKISSTTGNPGMTVNGTISRDSRPPEPSPTPVVRPSPRPPELPQRRPKVFRRLSFRTRLERNIPVLMEFSGEIDFETELEQKLRDASEEAEAPVPDKYVNLQFKSLPSATKTGQDGVVDFKINVTYDTATKQLTETLSLGAAPGDIDGLVRMRIPSDEHQDAIRFKNILGALLVFAPVINSAASALDPNSAGDWATLAVSLGVPVAIGGLNIFRTQAATLYGGEVKFRQILPSGTNPLRFTDAGVVFDYGVEFHIVIEALGINTERNPTPLKVRYKAVGFNLHFEDGTTYQPIFDTSKGYEIDLGDPGLFNLPAPLGNLMKVLSARIARSSPLTLELDIGMKVDLGVVTVDSFKVKVPLDPPGLPMILPTGVHVNIPKVLIGSGYVNIIEKTDNGVLQKGIEGALDITLEHPKVRVAASLSVVSLEDLDTQRKAIGVYAGLIVEFPTPILLWSTGLGLYGLNGLFAMNYKRTEMPRLPSDSVSPALKWLEKAKGEPSKLKIKDGDEWIELWGPDFDRWSFGVGLILGTIDGGFLMNFRGMFVLELPGPRILIFSKVQIISNLPELGDAKLTTGMLGVIDIDLNLEQVTMGVLVDLEIENLIQLKVPIEIFFKFYDLKDWHLYIGKIESPASALVLNLVRARGYFMISGDQIAPFPPAIGGNPPGPGLPAIAVAMGIEASVIFGDQDIGLYLRVSAGAHLGVSFSSRTFISGEIFLEGELRLFIVSIEARGSLTVEAPNPTFIHGEVCGKVDFFFFSVEGCVSIEIGEKPDVLEPPVLVRGVFLQSHAPVISEGQGGDRPIDASLGNAIELEDGRLPSGVSDDDIPVVPIDTVPVIQFFASPRITDDTTSTTTFTEPLKTPPLTPDGWINIGGNRRVRYLLREISLDPPLPASSPLPPATWRRDVPPATSEDEGVPTDTQGANTNIDLALFSRVPTTASRALERSTELNQQVESRWGNLCDPVAPPVCLLWTFCRQPLGPSGRGWTLTGIPQPDPPGTTRHASPITTLFVEEPILSSGESLLDLLAAGASEFFHIPARVIGRQSPQAGSGVQPSVCVEFRNPGKVKNPFMLKQIDFTVLDSHQQPVPQAEIAERQNFIGLKCGFRAQIKLPEPASEIAVTLVSFARPATVVVLLRDGNVLLKDMTEPQGKSETLKFKEKDIVGVRIIAPQDEILLLKFCYLTEKNEQDTYCFRALQLPRAQARNLPDPIKLTREAAEAIKSRQSNQWIILHTGEAESATVFAAAPQPLSQSAQVIQLDAKDNVLKQNFLADLSPQPVTGVSTGLPTAWLDPALPWRSEVLPVATFLAGAEFSSLSRFIFTIKPERGCVKIKILAQKIDSARENSMMIIGVINVCPKSEIERAEQAEEIRDGEIAAVKDYLNGGDLVPLLEPNETYTLTITYDVESDGSSSNVTQKFRFKTDASEPKRLDPWVLGTTPDAEEKYHFYEDPVKVVFNDISVVQLFNAYGKNLRAALRAADGLPMPDKEITTKKLDKVKAEISTPYREALEQLIAREPLPCIDTITEPEHGSYTLPPFLLRPLMAYTFEIEVDPPNPTIQGQPIMPLFRRSFVTSKFRNIAGLISDLKEKRIRHRALNQQVTGLPAGAPLTPGGTPVATATDKEIQDALVTAGEQALPAPSETGITIYWAKRPGASRFSPHIIMIDAAEPLWRTRSEPKLETVPDQDEPVDEAFMRVVPQSLPAMEIIEQSIDARFITRFVRSASGTRTLAFISDYSFTTMATTEVKLAVHSLPSALYRITGSTDELISLQLKGAAPWEDDNE